MTTTERHHYTHRRSHWGGRSFLRLHVLLYALLLFVAPARWAQAEVAPNVLQVTSHPADDLSPSLSPDGKWLAFTSKRAGNYDIWLKNIRTGATRRLTKHRADELHPVWESNQEYLVYVSQQSDAHGDLYRLNLRDVNGELIPKGEPERLTFYMGFDGYPSMSKNDQNIAWVSDRTGRPEIWLMTKRRKNVRQLTHGGATHPAWSPKQEYLAFTSFRDDGNNGDIWLLNLYAASELFERTTPLDSLERPMWPITTGPAVDGFPTWSKNANTLLFSRHDYDTNGDGRLSPADQSVLWSVDVTHLPLDSLRVGNPSYEMFRNSFNDRIALSARPVTPLYVDARQPSWNIDSTTFFISPIKGNNDIWSFENPHFFRLPEDSLDLEYIDEKFPLPRGLNSTQLDSLSAIRASLTTADRHMLWDRFTALHYIIDGAPTESERLSQALYEAGLCLTALSYGERAATYFDYIIKSFPQTDPYVAWTTLVLRTQQSLPKNPAHADVVNALVHVVGPLQDDYATEPAFLAQTDILLGNLWAAKGETDQAKFYYQRVKTRFPQFPSLCAQSLYLLGVLYEDMDQPVAFQSFLAVLEEYPDEKKWTKRAGDHLLKLYTQDAKTARERVDRYKQFQQRFPGFGALSVDPLFRAAALLATIGQLEEALAVYDSIAVRYQNQPDQVFTARLRRADLQLQSGELLKAAEAFQQISDDYRTSAPLLADRARERLVHVLLSSADGLKRAQNWELANLRYERALQLVPNHIQAHQGYIETLFYLGRAEYAVEKYQQLRKENPGNNVILYALGLAFSYRGTPQRDNLFLPGDVIPEDLERSNSILRSAMSYDYNLIEAYIALSYNYEMLENHLHWQKNKPQNFWSKAGQAISGPFVWLYHTVTFYNETKAPRYYENSIQVLTSALSLNDETTRPDLEAQIALNMANNYYNVGEFGFSKAYEFYHLRMQYDSTFADPLQEALIMERMGHCAMVVVDAERGPVYLERAIELYDERNDPDRVLVNTKRLALLYEFAENSQQALVYYERAAQMESRRGLYDGLLRSYRSLAYHHYLLHNQETAVDFANKGLDLLDSGLLQRSEGAPLFPQLGILGINLPIPFDLRRVGAKSVLQLTTDEEEAILYSILASTYQNERLYQRAISFYEKKLKIYEQRFDYEAQAIFLNNIAYLFFLQGDYDNAWYKFTESFWLANKKTKSLGIQLLNITNAANVWLTMAKEPDPSKRIKVEVRRDWIINQMNRLLRKTDENPLIYAQGRMQLYILLADVMALDIDRDDPAKVTENIRAAYRLVHNATSANDYLLQALAIAQDRGYVEDECAIRLKRGKVLQVLGQLDDALAELSTCRSLATQHQNVDVLWRVNTALGQLLNEIERNDPENYDFPNEPLYYFQQAIKISEAHPHWMPGFTAAHRRRLVQEPYREMIHIYLADGLSDKALAVAERMRERHVFDLCTEERIDFGGRRQDIYVTLDSLRRDMARMELALLSKSTVENQQQMSTLQKEYEAALQIMRREAPELEPFVKISPVETNAMRARLPDSLALIYQIASANESIFWKITRDTITVQIIPLNKITALQQLSNNQVPDALQALLRDHSDASINNIVFVPDYDFLIFPWSRLVKMSGDTPALPVVTSSLTTFVRAQQNHHPHGRAIYLAAMNAGDWSLPNYQTLLPIAQQSGNAFMAQRSLLAQADFMHLEAWADWNWMMPAFSSLQVSTPASQPATLTVNDLYSLNSRLSHLSLNFMNSTPPDPDAFIAWERAAIFLGTSTMIFSSNAALDSTGLFYQQFYRNFGNNAFQTALNEVDGHNSEPGYVQFYGAPAFVIQERETDTFTFDNLKLQAEAALQKHQWKTASNFYAQLAQQSQADNFYPQRLTSVLNAGQWDEAISLVEHHIDREKRLNNWQAVADAYRQLVALNDFLDQKQQAQEARANYGRLIQEYGFVYDPASAWIQLASMLNQGGSYKAAITFYTRAASAFEQQKDTLGVIFSHQQVGAICTHRLGDLDLALTAYEKAEKLAAGSGLEKNRIELLLAKSRAYAHFALWPSAKQYAIAAHAKAIEFADRPLQHQAAVLLATLHVALGDISAAETMLQTVPTDTIAPVSVEALLLQSRIKMQQNVPDESIRLAKRGADMADRLADIGIKAQATIYLARLYWYFNEFDNALASVERLLLLNDGHLTQAHLLAAAILIDRGEKEQAMRNLREADRTAKKYPDAADRALYAYLSSHATDDTAQARLWAERAAALADSLVLTPLSWRALWRLAQLAVLDNDDEAASLGYQNALTSLQRTYPTHPFDGYESNFVTAEKQFFDELVHFYVNRGQINSGLNVVEVRNKRLLQLAHFSNRHTFYHNTTDIAEGDSVRQELARIRAKLLLDKNSGSETPAALRQSAEQMQNQLWRSRVVNAHEQRAPSINDSLDVQHLASTVPEDVLLLRTFYENETLHYWLISRDSVYYIHAPFDPDTLRQNINELHLNVLAREETATASAALHASLVAPISNRLATKSTLIVIPYGALYNVPFAVLSRKGDMPLGLEKQILYSPVLPASYANTGAAPVQSIGAVSTVEGSLPSLALSANVAATLKRYIPSVELYDKDDFVAIDSLRTKPRHDAIYLGVNVRFGAIFPFEATVISPFETNEPSRVFSHWLSRLSAPMLIFHSATYDEVSYDGEFADFYNGLLNKGATAVMAPQWTPPELAGAVLLKRFFSYLAEGYTRGEALRLAQKTVFEQIDPHPSAWAAFRLFGVF